VLVDDVMLGRNMSH